VESSDVHTLFPEQRVEQQALCCCAVRGAADIIITDALAVALVFALLWTVILVSREILSALLGAGSVIKTVQQKSNARAIARALEHDPNGILNVIFNFSCGAKRSRWRRKREQRS